MDINTYDIIIRPRITPKAQRLNRKLQQVVLDVHPQATKPMIARALRIVFNAYATDIRTARGITKPRRQPKGRKKVAEGQKYKRAIVTLKQGTESEIMNASSAVPHAAYANTETAE